ncbi:exuperantia, partial [Danaus plexippus plexippus]
MSFQTS